MKKIPAIAFATVLLTGCGGHYVQPDAHAPHAVLEAVQGDNQMLFTKSEIHIAFYDINCTDTEETGVLGVRKEGTTERFLLKPDRRIFINVLAWGGLRQTDGYYSQSCVDIGSFVPSAGVTYQVSQRVRPGDCVVSIIDTRTGKLADGFRREPVQGECRVNKRG